MRVTVAVTARQAAVLAARQIARRLTCAAAERGAATLALSGGATGTVLVAELARLPLDWSAVHVFQTDERIAPAGDAARNSTAIGRALVETGLLPAGRLHAMPVDAADCEAGARAYAAELAAVAGEPPVLDVVHLGLGTDGHTASLFAGEAALAATTAVACTAGHAGFRRMTLTLPVINAACHIVWLVTGAAKREPLARLTACGWEAPAGRVARRRAVVYADRAAKPA